MTKLPLLLLLALMLNLPHTGGAETNAPSEINNKDWLLAFVDVETTGLQPGFHEMIDVGMIITDLDGVPIEKLFLRIMPAHPERTEPGAAAVNGFSVRLWQERGFVSEAAAVRQMLAFTERVSGEKELLMVGYNAWFDISFIDHLFRSQNETWRKLFHYFVLDLPSMAWGQKHRSLTGAVLSEELGIDAETSNPLLHTGLSGAEYNLRLYQALFAEPSSIQAPPLPAQ